VEPASAAGLAGLKAELDAGMINVKGKRVVVVCTGHGMKDPDIIVKNMTAPVVVDADFKALEKVILQ
jgi:threonine synthase